MIGLVGSRGESADSGVAAAKVPNRSGVGVDAEGKLQACRKSWRDATNKQVQNLFFILISKIKRSSLRLVYKPHSVQWIAPFGQSSLWAVRHRAARCSLPGTDPTHRREGYIWRRAASHRPQTKSSLLGLAPGGGYLATRITARAGGLLHHLFTITLTLSRVEGCLFLWPLSGRFSPFGGFPVHK